jgi:hypothetical protein
MQRPEFKQERYISDGNTNHLPVATPCDDLYKFLYEAKFLSCKILVPYTHSKQ